MVSNYSSGSAQTTKKCELQSNYNQCQEDSATTDRCPSPLNNTGITHRCVCVFSVVVCILSRYVPLLNVHWLLVTSGVGVLPIAGHEPTYCLQPCWPQVRFYNTQVPALARLLVERGATLLLSLMMELHLIQSICPRYIALYLFGYIHNLVE